MTADEAAAWLTARGCWTLPVHLRRLAKASNGPRRDAAGEYTDASLAEWIARRKAALAIARKQRRAAKRSASN